MPRARFSFLVVVFAVVAALSFAPHAALANPDAEKFTSSVVDQALKILRDSNGDEAARAAKLHQLVTQNLDARKTALFALGSYQRGLDRKTTDTYVAAFTDYITAVYEARLRKFRHLEIKVVSSIDNGPADTTVVTQGTPTADFRDKDAIIIRLRLNGSGARYKIVDVEIAGMWVSIYQREEFAKMLSENRANLSALISYLANEAAQVKSGAKAT